MHFSYRFNTFTRENSYKKPSPYSFTCSNSKTLYRVTCIAAANVPQTHARKYSSQQRASVCAPLANNPGPTSARMPATRTIAAMHKNICSKTSIHLARFFVTPRIRMNAASLANCSMTSPGPNSPINAAAATALGNNDSKRSRTRLVFFKSLLYDRAKSVLADFAHEDDGTSKFL